MPTYVCWTRAGQLSSDQRQRIAKSITEAHHEVTRAPRYFVQVIFNELPAHSHYVGGDEAESDHVWIRADVRSGRTPEQKARLMSRIANNACEISNVSKEKIWVYLSDIPGSSVIEFGHILPEPGEEGSWFAQLPHSLQEKLRSRA